MLGGICVIGPEDETEPSYVYREVGVRANPKPNPNPNPKPNPTPTPIPTPSPNPYPYPYPGDWLSHPGRRDRGGDPHRARLAVLA